MRLLLTGATGLIGKHVLERLVQSGHTVRVLALPATVEQVPHHRRVKVSAGGLEDQRLLDKAAQGVSIVYHLAGLVPGCPPEDLIRVNVNGTRNLLRASLSARVRRFVFISSTAVYAPPDFLVERNIDESHPLRKKADGYLKHYAQSKIGAEKLILHCHHKFG